MLKKGLRAATAHVYHASGYLDRQLMGKVAILMYHRVLTGHDLQGTFVQPGMYVHADVFEQQMTFLRRHFEIISFADFLGMLNERKWRQDKRYCIVTFDDGWRDNYLHAFPTLRKMNIPATIFLPAMMINTNKRFWSDTLGVLLYHHYARDIRHERRRSLRDIVDRYPIISESSGSSIPERIETVIHWFKNCDESEIEDLIDRLSGFLGIPPGGERAFLNWNEIEEMSNYGISFGSHACSHRILTRMDVRDAWREIQDSYAALREHDLDLVPVFCYPNGNWSADIAELVKRAGYQAAVSTQFGWEEEYPRDMFALKRIGLHNDISHSQSLLSFHLSGLVQRVL